MCLQEMDEMMEKTKVTAVGKSAFCCQAVCGILCRSSKAWYGSRADSFEILFPCTRTTPVCFVSDHIGVQKIPDVQDTERLSHPRLRC